MRGFVLAAALALPLTAAPVMAQNAPQPPKPAAPQPPATVASHGMVPPAVVATLTCSV